MGRVCLLPELFDLILLLILLLNNKYVFLYFFFFCFVLNGSDEPVVFSFLGWFCFFYGFFEFW